MITTAPIEPLARHAAGTGSTTWLGLLTRWLLPTSLSAAEETVLDLMKRAARLSGAPLLEATSRQDLDDRIEQAVVEPDFLRFNAEAARLLTFDVIAQTTALAAPSTEMVRVLGVGPATQIVQCGPWAGAVASVTAQLLAASRDEAVLVWPGVIDDDLMRFIAAPGVHSTVKRAVFEGLRSSAGLLGAVHALFDGHRLEPWLALALAETYRGGLYEYLRYLASLPVHVPESIVPLADRFDLRALQHEVDASEARWGQLADAAAASGQDVDLCEVVDDS